MAFIRIEIELLADSYYAVHVTKSFDVEHGGGTQTFSESGGISIHRALDVARSMVTVSPAFREESA
jgi:hypothetical protein